MSLNENENQHTFTDDNASRNICSGPENGGLSPLQSTIADFPSNSQSNTTLPNNLFDEFLNLIWSTPNCFPYHFHRFVVYKNLLWSQQTLITLLLSIE